LGQGKIEFLTSGQLPIPPGTSQQIKETKQAADDTLAQAEKEKNSVGEAGLLEGAIPIWGSGRDLIHSIQTGDKLGMALNAGFLVWDAASVVAGVFSFGTATVAMAGAKAGVRGLLKAGVHVAANAAKKEMLEVAAKSLALKNGLKALKPFGKKVAKECVTACFPAGTLVAVADDYCAIEDLRVGDLVWAWQEDGNNLALKPIVALHQHQTDALVALHIGSEVIRATPEHPFLLINNEWKLAGQLVIGDELMRSDGVGLPVRGVEHETEQSAQVYNIEVADWPTYLVGEWLVVVHNGVCDDIAKLVTEAAEAAKKAGPNKVGVVLDDAAKVRNKGPFGTGNFAKEGVGDSEALAKNMHRDMSLKRPPEHAAHHIVMKKPRNGWTDKKAQKAVTESQEILKRNKIGIDNANNGVYLPTRRRTIDSPTRVANSHSPIHTTDYAIHVRDRLKGAEKLAGQKGVLSELEALRTEMETGIFTGHLK
jgi:hypothetical protein